MIENTERSPTVANEPGYPRNTADNLPKLRVGMLWHTLGHANLGVDALTRANLGIVREAAFLAGYSPHFVLLGTRGLISPEEVDVEQGPSVQLKRLLSGWSDSIFAAIRTCDVIFDISEGDSFTDIYGFKRFLIQSATKVAAIAAGPLVLSPQTLGPFNSVFARPLAKRILTSSRLTFARDHLSSAMVNQLAPTARLCEAIDVAFALPFERPPLSADGPIRIGINVSGLLFVAGHRFQLSIEYAALTRQLISTLLKSGKYEVWLVPHVLCEGVEDDDIAITKRLSVEFPGARVAPPLYDSVAAKSFISGMDFFVGGRMHACIAAFSSGVPVVPIAYSRKFNGMFQSLNYDRMVDGRAMDNEAALATVLKTLDERALAKQEIEMSFKEAIRRLLIYKNALRSFFEELPHA